MSRSLSFNFAVIGIGSFFAFEEGGNEGVEVAVEDALNIGGLFAGAEVFDHLVGLENVGPDLAAPTDVAFFAVVFFLFGPFFVHLDFVEAGFENGEGSGAVFDLGAVVLAGDNESGGKVGDADGGVGGVDALSAVATGAVDIDADVFVENFDLNGFIQLGQDVEGGKGGLAFSCGVEGRDANEPVDPALRLEVAVGVVARDKERGTFNAGFLPGKNVEDLGGQSVAFGPALVHAEKHVGPVAGLGSAGAGVEADDGIEPVMRSGEEDLEFQFVEGGHCRGDLGVELLNGVGGAVLRGHVAKQGKFANPAGDLAEKVEFGTDVTSLNRLFLGGGGVVPEPRLGHEGFEFAQATFKCGNVKETSGAASHGRRGWENQQKVLRPSEERSGGERGRQGGSRGGRVKFRQGGSLGSHGTRGLRPNQRCGGRGLRRSQRGGRWRG